MRITLALLLALLPVCALASGLSIGAPEVSPAGRAVRVQRYPSEFYGPVIRGPAVIINNGPSFYTLPPGLAAAEPAAGETLDVSPPEVALSFTFPPSAEGSAIRVLDMYGSERAGGTPVIRGGTMAVGLPPLPPGRYTVRWRVRCQCGNVDSLSDRYHFTVRRQ